MINLILLIVATLLGIVLVPISFCYTLIRNIWSRTNLSNYFWKCALSIDQTGNTVCQYLFNDLMIKPNGHRFGDEDQTCSYVFGKNKRSKKLYPLGYAIAWILDKIDKNHVEKAVKNEQ